jgi:alkylation response protein AidB-like acyl-CoA dehydrogenase
MDLDERLGPVLDVAERNAADVDRDGRFPTEAMQTLAGAGLLAIDGGPEQFLAVTRGLASSCASTAMVYVMHVCAARVIAAAPPPDGGEEVLREIAAGEHLSTLAFSERGSRSHFWAPVSTLGDGALHADKSFVTSAGHADSYVTSVGVGDGASSVYLVPAKSSGISVGGAWDGLGLRGNASAPMTFDVAVSDGMRLGATGQGLELMLGVVLPWFQLGSGGVSLGLAEAATRATVAHVTKARLEHAGSALIDLPVVRGRVGRMQVEVDTLAGFLSDAARRMAAGDPQAPVLSMKASANEIAVRVTEQAMQACGGVAFGKALPIERYFRDARAGSVMAPTTDVLYEITGRALAGMELL